VGFGRGKKTYLASLPHGAQLFYDRGEHLFLLGDDGVQFLYHVRHVIERAVLHLVHLALHGRDFLQLVLRFPETLNHKHDA